AEGLELSGRSPMWAYPALFTLASILPAGPAGQSPAPTAFPDLSDPKAAAFSLAVALARSDVKAAREAYAGEEKLFLEHLDALARTKAKADKLQRAITDRFGQSGWIGLGQGFETELKVRVGNIQAPLWVAIAVAKVKQEGDQATLAVSGDLELRLKKTKAGWKVSSFPGPSPLGFLTLKLV